MSAPNLSFGFFHDLRGDSWCAGRVGPMLGGIKQSNMMLKSIVIFSDFPEKTPCLFEVWVDVGRLFSSNISCFLSNKVVFSIGLDTEILGKRGERWSTWGRAPNEVMDLQSLLLDL